ncbi:hypothetical protein FB45DRAFT_1053560 [Roridomyces roridus]|uniref:F-box domain-containing protein n=1 Tax=Roridomyces roridus TaxID=1738132 RepID=A0AAD7CCF8_9AGAR|nr:hypothetical protein FB45DRAFT_1053560 [Roridomyces roridus]
MPVRLENPLEIPELVDHTLSFLDANSDFRACALVSRTWVYPAQRRIFSDVRIAGNRDFVRLQVKSLLEAVRRSPHLADFVLSISVVDLEYIDLVDFRTLGTVPFTSLVSLEIVSHHTERPTQAVLTIQRLLRIPSLTSAVILCSFASRDHFLRIWDECSRNIRYLSYPAICYFSGSPPHPGKMDHALPGYPLEERIKLEALAENNREAFFDSWLDDPGCPFDASGLKAYKFQRRSNQLCGALADSRHTIEVISIGPLIEPEIMTLKDFTRLVQLDITWGPGTHWEGVDFVFNAIRTIEPEHRHSLAVLRFDITQGSLKLERWMMAEIAGQICMLSADLTDGFPGLRVVEISIDPETPALVGPDGFDSYFEALGGEIEVQWNFDPSKREPWYKKLV